MPYELDTKALRQRFVQNLKEYAVLILDANGLVVDWNEGAAALKGYTAEEIIGQHFGIFYTLQARAVSHPERELLAAAAIGQYQEEGWRVRKDGSQFWAHVLIAPIFDDSGTLRGFGKIVRDFTLHKQYSEQSENIMKLLELTARTDYLTGFENRRSLDKELARVLSAGKRHERPVCLAMIDLDLFKNYNDQFGHLAGDIYLKKATAVWRSSLRPEDFIARYGGEEFVAVLPDTELTGAIETMERLRRITPSPLTCSIGVALWNGDETANELIGRADKALYQAKNSGRNIVTTAPVKPVECSNIA